MLVQEGEWRLRNNSLRGGILEMNEMKGKRDVEPSSNGGLAWNSSSDLLLNGIQENRTDVFPRGNKQPPFLQIHP